MLFNPNLQAWLLEGNSDGELAARRLLCAREHLQFTSSPPSLKQVVLFNRLEHKGIWLFKASIIPYTTRLHKSLYSQRALTCKHRWIFSQPFKKKKKYFGHMFPTYFWRWWTFVSGLTEHTSPMLLWVCSSQFDTVYVLHVRFVVISAHRVEEKLWERPCQGWKLRSFGLSATRYQGCSSFLLDSAERRYPRKPLWSWKPLAFLPGSIIAWGKRRHVSWFTTATQMHVWNHYGNMKHLPADTGAAERTPLFSPTLPPLLLYFPSFLFSSPLACLTVWRCRHSTGNKDRSGTKKQGGKPSERSLLRRRCIFDCFFFFSTRLSVPSCRRRCCWCTFSSGWNWFSLSEAWHTVDSAQHNSRWLDSSAES